MYGKDYDKVAAQSCAQEESSESRYSEPFGTGTADWRSFCSYKVFRR